MRLFLLPLPLLLCSQNLDDCLGKLQAMLDAGVEAVTPKEIDPETIKRVKAA
jgi:peptidyl-tRNA hydrolase ICT1